MSVEYHPAVEAELKAIKSYYEDRSPGVGVRFTDEFERQVLELAARPERWMVATVDIRRCLMKRFPYLFISGVWIQSESGLQWLSTNGGIRIMAVSESKPNQRHAVDAGRRVLFVFGRQWSGPTEKL